MGPNKYSEYSQEQRKKLMSKRAKSNLGVYPIKKA